MSEATSYKTKRSGKVIEVLNIRFPPSFSWRVHCGVLNQSLHFAEHHTCNDVRTAFASIRNVDYLKVQAARVK